MRLFTLLVLVVSASGYAADSTPRTPRAPCAHAPVPAYAPVGAQPAAGTWTGNGSGVRIDASCADELGIAFDALITLSGSFRFEGDRGQLLERLGAVSKMKGLRYWSTTDQQWTPLITRSYAVEQPGADARYDFSAAEMRDRKDVYFVQTDNRSRHEVTFRMRVTVEGPDRITAQIQNVSPVRYFMFTAYAPGDLRTAYFLRRRSGDVWDFYLVSAVRKMALGTNEASLLNRAAAAYRYVSGTRADQAPPLAP